MADEKKKGTHHDQKTINPGENKREERAKEQAALAQKQQVGAALAKAGYVRAGAAAANSN